jgi:hypothetical protein
MVISVLPLEWPDRNGEIKAGPVTGGGMDRLRLAPTVGVLASLLVVVVLALPYAVASSEAVTAYYTSGVITPFAGGLLALVAIIVFAAGREGRSDPAIADGTALALGIVAVVVALAWAMTTRTDVFTLAQYDGLAFAMLQYHRHAFVLASVGVPAAAVWYARELGMF